MSKNNEKPTRRCGGVSLAARALALGALFASFCSVQVTLAQSEGQKDGFSNPCKAAPFTDFDLWVGDWVAFNYDTKIAQGVDRIEKINNGCTIMQDWRQMTDNYRTPGAPYRYAGVSFSSVIGPGKWQQVWVGNSGGTITLTGGLNDDGVMELTSPETKLANGSVIKRTWRWRREENGDVHSWGENQNKGEDGAWSKPTIVWNIRYVSRHGVAPLVVKPVE